MKGKLTFTNILLCILTISVLWLAAEISYMQDQGSAFMQNSDSGYTIIKTRFGNFPVIVSKTKAVTDGTEITLTIINPMVIHFGDAKVSIDINGTIETKTLNLSPSVNTAKFKVAPLKRGDPINVSLELNQIYFK